MSFEKLNKFSEENYSRKKYKTSDIFYEEMFQLSREWKDKIALPDIR
jgi:hypothetical protein